MVIKHNWTIRTVTLGSSSPITRTLPSSLAQSQRLYRVPLPRDRQNISNNPAPARSEANTPTHAAPMQGSYPRQGQGQVSNSYVMKYSGSRTAFAQHRVGKGPSSGAVLGTEKAVTCRTKQNYRARQSLFCSGTRTRGEMRGKMVRKLARGFFFCLS